MPKDRFKQLDDELSEGCLAKQVVCDRLIALIRAELSPTDAEPIVAVSCSIGPALVGGVVEGDGGLAGRSSRVVRPLERWFKFCDPERARLGSVWWFALTVGGSDASLEESRDAWPPDWMQQVLRANGLDLDDDVSWFLQARSYDRRPPERLPQWWVEKLRSVGAWDEENHRLALDENRHPSYGRQ